MPINAASDVIAPPFPRFCKKVGITPEANPHKNNLNSSFTAISSTFLNYLLKLEKYIHSHPQNLKYQKIHSIKLWQSHRALYRQEYQATKKLSTCLTGKFA
jgi:hypothetical protein